jgi:hypothetical protein
MMDQAPSLPSPERLAYVIAGDLAEDDVGLWEIVWGLNSTNPEAPLDEKVRIARRAVSLLSNEAELWHGDPLEPGSGPLSAAELRALAEDDLAWHDPANASLIVWLRATA